MAIRKDTILFVCDFETTGVDPKKDYPIEIGGLFVDHDFNIISTFDELICWENEKILNKKVNLIDKEHDWKEEYSQAYKIHKILPNAEYFLKGKRPISIVNRLGEYIDDNFKNKKIIITSDNAQFEYNFMKKLWNFASTREFPFHYCAWDTSLLLEMTGIGDPRNVPHRAFKDVSILYKHIVLSLNKIKGE